MFDLGLKILQSEEKKTMESKIQDKAPIVSPESTIWINISKMHNTAFAVDMAAKKVVAVVTADREIRNAVATLRSAKANIKEFGASEAVMCIFNENNMLADVLGMSIPTITADNATAIGTACVENIDAVVDSAYDKVKEFFAAICEAASKFFERFKAQAECQCATIGEVITNIIDKAEGVDDAELGKENVFGYTQPVFMERIGALQFIIDNLAACGCSNEELRKFESALKTLGYKVVEKNEADAVVAPETPAEQAADAPAEVMDPEQPEAAEKVSSEDVAPDAAQEQPMAVFRWTQATIKTSAEALKALLAGANKFDGVATKLGEVRGNVMAAIETISSANGEEKAEKENIIECGRNYAAFVGDIIGVFGGSVSELVDQIVCMASKLSKQKAEGNGQPDNVGTEPVAPAANEPEQNPVVPTEEPAGEPAPAVNQEPAPAPEGEQPAPAPEGGEQPQPEGEQPSAANEPAPAPENSKGNWWDDEFKQPENVPNDAPVKTPNGVDPNGEAEPGKAPHIVPTETPEGEQPNKKAEPFMEDVIGTRLF